MGANGDLACAKTQGIAAAVKGWSRAKDARLSEDEQAAVETGRRRLDVPAADAMASLTALRHRAERIAGTPVRLVQVFAEHGAIVTEEEAKIEAQMQECRDPLERAEQSLLDHVELADVAVPPEYNDPTTVLQLVVLALLAEIAVGTLVFSETSPGAVLGALTSAAIVGAVNTVLPGICGYYAAHFRLGRLALCLGSAGLVALLLAVNLTVASYRASDLAGVLGAAKLLTSEPPFELYSLGFALLSVVAGVAVAIKAHGVLGFDPTWARRDAAYQASALAWDALRSSCRQRLAQVSRRIVTAVGSVAEIYEARRTEASEIETQLREIEGTVRSCIDRTHAEIGAWVETYRETYRSRTGGRPVPDYFGHPVESPHLPEVQAEIESIEARLRELRVEAPGHEDLSEALSHAQKVVTEVLERFDRKYSRAQHPLVVRRSRRQATWASPGL